VRRKNEDMAGLVTNVIFSQISSHELGETGTKKRSREAGPLIVETQDTETHLTSLTHQTDFTSHSEDDASKFSSVEPEVSSLMSLAAEHTTAASELLTGGETETHRRMIDGSSASVGSLHTRGDSLSSTSSLQALGTFVGSSLIALQAEVSDQSHGLSY
jgi:hypothetical protein